MNFEMYEKKRRSDYADLADTVGMVLKTAIEAHSNRRLRLGLQQIKHRAKDPESLRKKLKEAGVLETEKIEEVVKDLAGCRLVFYTNSDVSQFLLSGIVRDNFEIDWDRTKIHHPSQDTSSATELFSGHNFVVRFNEQRIALPEYARFRGLWCEVQIQTTLNHAWSEMAHDTIYKKPKLKGFGGRLMQQIEQRMEKIMRDYLLPAGYEFQKVVTDFERLSIGKELFDQDALTAFANSKDNNELHDLMERFSTYVLPYYDDLQSVQHEIRSAVLTAVKQARKTPTRPIETPFGAHPGFTVEQVVGVAADILDRLRYLDVEATFNAICELFSGAESDEERKRLILSAEHLSKNNLDVWKQVGPLVQHLLVGRIRCLNIEELIFIKPVVLKILGQVLAPEVEGTSSTYKTFTIHTGTVVPSEMLINTRSNAIEILKDLFRDAKTDAERREVIHTLSTAMRFPHRGNYSNELFKIVLNDKANIVEFYKEVANDLSYELLQALEDELLLLYRRSLDMPSDITGDPEITISHQRLIRHILDFRDITNSNHEFIIYKVLVGFESVFPPAWDDPNFDWEAQEAYRNHQIKKLVDEVSEENANEWFARLLRCAQTESNDLATFPSFGRFLKELGRSKPNILIAYLDRLDDRLANFLPAMLSGLESGGKGDIAQEKIRHWVETRQYLSQIIWYEGFAADFDADLLEEALRGAIEVGDDIAVLNAVSTSALRHGDVEGGLIDRIFLPALGYLTEKGDSRWINALWPSRKEKSLLEGLKSEQVDQVLASLVRHPQIDHRVEDILASIAASWPTKVVDFFDSRLKVDQKSMVGDKIRYEAIPFKFYRLHDQLAKVPEYLLEKSRSWFEEDKLMFQYRGGQLLSIVFPNFPPEFELILQNLIESRDKADIEFVAKILRTYDDGQVFIYSLCKEIVALLPPEDPLLNEIEAALGSTGVVTGEFGFVDAYKRKKTEIEPWLEDPREQVQSFARRLLLSLDRRIAAEQRRSEERLELRKREYNEIDE
ncbi:MAG: RelA/SpoT domain-containing protein [Deltaproteobacteria bacterium]|nr:RelA/SpoT domain-containing protein [Deltaproteobacteria bacterium]